MRRYGLIGFPLGHSFSQKYFLEKFKNEKIIDADFTLYELENLVGFRDWVNSQQNLQGLSVTIPYKKLVLQYLDEVDPLATEVDAVNCIKVKTIGNDKHLKGYNTDIIGFELSLKPLLKDHHKKAYRHVYSQWK